MADEKLAAQLSKLKTTLLKWTELLDGFKTYALANDGVVDASEKAQIARIQGDIDAIKARIFQIETKKGLNEVTTEEVVTTDLYKISGSVGKGGTNDKTDVTLVQSLLNRHGAGLSVDGGYGGKTLAAIEKFQSAKLGEKTGLIAPSSPTFKALLAKPDKTVEGQEEMNSGLGAKGKLGNTIIKKGDYIFSLPPNAAGALPLLMLFSGLNQNASTLMGQVPDVYYLKAIMVFAGPKGKFTAAQSLYTPVLTENSLSTASISICGYSLGGQAAFDDYGHATKAVGLIDPTTYYDDLAKIDSKAVFSANGKSSAWNWSGKKTGDKNYQCKHARQDGIKTALARGGVGEDTSLAHNVYPQYFLSKFRSKLI